MSWCLKMVYFKNIAKRLENCCIRFFTENSFSGKDHIFESNDNIKPVKELLNDNILPLTKRVEVDPDDRSVLLFPGQGSQYIGMADDLLNFPNVKHMFNVASELLHFDLLNYCQNGPEVELNRTVHCQPAIFVTSLAGIEKIQALHPEILENCVAAAGFSIGEFAALVFSGVLTFENAIRLIGVRCKAMQDACEMNDSRMVAAIGSTNTRFSYACLQAREYCSEELSMENPVCSVASYLYTNAVTIGGNSAAIQFLLEHAKQYNIRKLVPINVSGAFHTCLMYPAKVNLKNALKGIDLQEPLIDIYSNVTGKKYGSTTQIRQYLSDQVVKPVKWEQIMHKLFDRSLNTNMPNIYEVGPGKQFGAIIKKCNENQLLPALMQFKETIASIAGIMIHSCNGLSRSDPLMSELILNCMLATLLKKGI